MSSIGGTQNQLKNKGKIRNRPPDQVKSPFLPKSFGNVMKD